LVIDTTIIEDMDTVTYSLKLEKSNSQEYYKTVREFTNEVIKHSEKTLLPIASDFKEYLISFNLEDIREDEEYILELLSFGILWYKYSQIALHIRFAPFITLSNMSEWRKKHQHLKPYIDSLRGILFTLFILPKVRTKKDLPLATLEQIDHACKWFEATGEFREQVLRFIRWRAYWKQKDPEELFRIFKTIKEFTRWFEENSNSVLGKYTMKVNQFLENSSAAYRWREDRISCTRSRLEYHLNMVGAELMNRAFRDNFKKTETKAVLLPGCMRWYNNEKCKARRIKEGLICGGCQSKCRVNQIREMGRKNNFEVYIIPHASDLSLWSPQAGKPTRGVIASACVTTLVEGGWELKRYNVPAQCVLLDYSGCKKHWHCSGMPTSLNIHELKSIMN